MKEIICDSILRIITSDIAGLKENGFGMHRNDAITDSFPNSVYGWKLLFGYPPVVLLRGRAQDIKIYGSRLEIAERIYKEISAQAYSRRVFNKDEFIVSTLLDICDNLKEKDPELAKFLVPGITERISTNMMTVISYRVGGLLEEEILMGHLKNGKKRITSKVGRY